VGSAGEPPDCHKHAELKRKLYSAISECDEGELSIAIPKEVSLRTAGHFSSNGAFGECALFLFRCGVVLSQSVAATPEPQAQGQSSQAAPEYAPIVVNIAYSLRNPVDGFEFVVPTDAYPYVSPQLSLAYAVTEDH